MTSLPDFGYDADDPVPRDDDGERVLPDKLLERLAAHRAPDEMPGRSEWFNHPDLTRRELQVLGCASHGLESLMAADVLGMGLETVKTALKGARYKLRAKNTAHAVYLAMKAGLIE